MSKGERVKRRAANMSVLNVVILIALYKNVQFLELKRKRFTENGKSNEAENFSARKGNYNEWEGEDKGKGKNQNDNVRFTEVENGSPGNAAFSLDVTAGGSGVNRVNSPGREVLTPNEMLGRNGWEIKPLWGNQKWMVVLAYLDLV